MPLITKEKGSISTARIYFKTGMDWLFYSSNMDSRISTAAGQITPVATECDTGNGLLVVIKRVDCPPCAQRPEPHSVIFTPRS